MIRAFLAESTDAVHRIVYLATPHRGSLSALAYLHEGLRIVGQRPDGPALQRRLPGHASTWLPAASERVFVDTTRRRARPRSPRRADVARAAARRSRRGSGSPGRPRARERRAGPARERGEPAVVRHRRPSPRDRVPRGGRRRQGRDAVCGVRRLLAWSAIRTRSRPATASCPRTRWPRRPASQPPRRGGWRRRSTRGSRLRRAHVRLLVVEALLATPSRRSAAEPAVAHRDLATAGRDRGVVGGDDERGARRGDLA